uniref:Uncharacterized protein n=1 Tax=Panagrolaimus sp. ES5 TaxID=591445 RepID=A0AC34G9Y1_9BILA
MKLKGSLADSKVKSGFETPRQQSDNGNLRPEIMCFKASQRLLNPNQSNEKNIERSNPTDSRMKLFSLNHNGWQEVGEVPSNLIDAEVHTLLIFREPLCSNEPTAELTPSSALVFDFVTNEVQFQRDSDSQPLTRSLCSMAFVPGIESEYTIKFQRDSDSQPLTGSLCSMAFVPGIENEYTIKVHCQNADSHLQFHIPSSLAVFEDDDLAPDEIQDFVISITATREIVISHADEEIHVATVTPAQEKLKALMCTLENNKLKMFASPTNSILATKLHHNLAVRCLCEPRINEIRILIENKQLDFNSIVFHVLPHRTIPDNFEVVKGNQTFAAYLQLKSLK